MRKFLQNFDGNTQGKTNSKKLLSEKLSENRKTIKLSNKENLVKNQYIGDQQGWGVIFKRNDLKW